MKTVSDTSVLIALFSASIPEAKAMLEESLTVSALTVAEFCSYAERRGFSRSDTEARIRSIATVLPLDATTAVNAGEIHAQQRRKRKKFGMVDACIYATAQRAGATLFTCDADFEGLPGVKLLER